VLYRADAEPIVALLAADPLFRDLSSGVQDGPDVAALEANLVVLGYGSGVTQDEHFDAGTAAAVRRWETALGRAAPDGVVTVGEVMFLDEPTAVLEHQLEVGDLLESGDPVLVLGAESRVIDTDVIASEVASWPVGTPVEVRWGDDTTSTGTVTAVSRDESGGEIDLVVTIAGDAGRGRPIGSSVEVVRTVSDEAAPLAVPVAAVVEGPSGPAVRVTGGGDDRIVPVELGVVADGWVAVTKGLAVGDRVRLPG
jgi:peptidoglycan hydrolase-like protein with peptidoglycan-binding domain